MASSGRAAADRFNDDQTGSTCDVSDRAVAGELEGQALTRVHHLDTFWFVWATYQPGSELLDG